MKSCSWSRGDCVQRPSCYVRPNPLLRCEPEPGRRWPDSLVVRTRSSCSSSKRQYHTLTDRCSGAAARPPQRSQQSPSIRRSLLSWRCRASADTQAASASTSSPEVDAIKTALLDAVRDIDRGIFGMQAEDREHVLGLIAQLEVHNPLQDPAQRLERVAGGWRLLFSTITILGRKRSKLGLRDFIELRELTQSIDTERQLAVNTVGFCVAGLGMLQGALAIEASYKAVSPTRVDITFQSASLTPKQLNALFQQNYDLLLSIFNPEGWLEITYVDDAHRVGRDDKGNVFFLERC